MGCRTNNDVFRKEEDLKAPLNVSTKLVSIPSASNNAVVEVGEVRPWTPKDVGLDPLHPDHFGSSAGKRGDRSELLGSLCNFRVCRIRDSLIALSDSRLLCTSSRFLTVYVI